MGFLFECDVGCGGFGLLFGLLVFLGVGYFVVFVEFYWYVFYVGMEQQGFYWFGFGYQVMDDVYQVICCFVFQYLCVLGFVVGFQVQFVFEYVKCVGYWMDLLVQVFMGGQVQVLYGELWLVKGIVEVE